MGLPGSPRRRPAPQASPEVSGQEVTPSKVIPSETPIRQATPEVQAQARFLAPKELDFPEVLGELELLKPQCAAINFHTREGYELGKGAIQQCTKLRSAIEAKRVELKQPALDWGRKVDAKAKDLMGLIEDIEQPLKARKLEVDKAEEARRREDERKAREAEELRLRTEREANEKAAREAAEKLKLLEQKEAEMRVMEEQWAKKHGTEAPPVEVPKGEAIPQGPRGIPPRRPVASATPSTVTVIGGSTATLGGHEDGTIVVEPSLEQLTAEAAGGWPTLVRIMGKGFGFQAHPVGGAVQFAIHGNKRAWHGTGNTLAQAVELAWGRHQAAPADVEQ